MDTEVTSNVGLSHYDRCEGLTVDLLADIASWVQPGSKSVLHKRVSLPCAWRWSYAPPALFDVISGSPWREGKLRQRRAVSA